ncbi:hypothetical protein Q5424_16680 [Conexibacter sp. JD483]|uniref:hypothetical protein n=1 Tax=unclassified Conexibacter TaxID=2627773 RepID=UPI002720B1E0|nr:MULTISPECIES: hypothetical protein [unclassified Conexibacter]MDO8188650.1 hypothetical protein [Conexibacter sp. CPCC 205706]MDO8201514.1 hypothetical protein [Conexibacter sp. CPCC 205762]MDR9370733.1 hypothetical protein [Conexibacter sp. JD483]
MRRLTLTRPLVSLVLAALLAAGAAGAADAARPKCRAGYELKKKRGAYRCVRRPKQPKPPRDAVYPSSIELIVATLKERRFGATGFMRFSAPVTGTAYGSWIVSNGITRERFPFTLRHITRTDYMPFTIGYPIETAISGKAVTVTLEIGRVRSNAAAAKQ